MMLRALAVAILIATAGAPRLLAQSPAEVEAAMAPVEIDGTALFRVRGVSSLPAADRASAIRARIIAVAADPAISVEAIHAEAADGMQKILAGSQLLMAVVDADAAIEQVSAAELAIGHVQRIRQAITEYREARTDVAFESDLVNISFAT